ncbi:acyltransferase [Corynebacterium efficiens YS-314]|nr:acyltransferase [Corynebacterium efficiens YS-314]
MDWPDVAKGLSILGVVLLHVTLAVPGAKDSFLAELNHILDPLRMPLFFLVSGFFSVKVLTMTFEQLFKRRLWFFLVPYLVWTPIELYTSRLQGMVFHGHQLPDWFYYVAKVADSTNMYWFLYFLVWFNLLLWATRKLPAWMIVTLVAVVPWLFMPMFGDSELLRKTIIYLPAFFIGVYFRPLITRFAEVATRPKAVVLAVAAYVAALGIAAVEDVLITRVPGPTQLWFIGFKDEIALLLGGELSAFALGHFSGTLIRLLSLPAGVALAVWLSRATPVARVLMFLGRHTLVIYIGHALGLTLLFGFTVRERFMVIDNDSSNPLYWTGTWMAIAFALAMAGGYLLHLLTRAPVLKWTLAPPRLPESRTGQRVDTPESSRITIDEHTIPRA